MRGPVGPARGIFRYNHERYYRAPTATWGYDATQDTFFFGHRSCRFNPFQGRYSFETDMLLEERITRIEFQSLPGQIQL